MLFKSMDNTIFVHYPRTLVAKLIIPDKSQLSTSATGVEKVSNNCGTIDLRIDSKQLSLRIEMTFTTVLFLKHSIQLFPCRRGKSILSNISMVSYGSFLTEVCKVLGVCRGWRGRGADLGSSSCSCRSLAIFRESFVHP